jgi:radical SAM superfamily enzyme YgiQ (UPF0313 family)
MEFERPDIVRPPSEWKSYFLPVTRGCSNNTCTFCAWYGSKLQTRNIDDIKKEIDALALYMDHGVRLPSVPDIVYAIARQWDGRRVFLQDGDALVYPFPKLREALQYLNEKFPLLERVGIYGTPQDALRKSASELKELRDLKMGIIYLGVESGDEEILRRVGKGADRRQIVEAGRKVKEAGIVLSATVILGLGGIERSHEHSQATARILTDIDSEYAGALTLTLVPGTPLYHQWQEGGFSPLSPFDSLQELRTIMENSSFSNCFFSSMHASNYISIRGRLPGDKEKMLKELDYVLNKKDPALLRPEYMRGL